MKELMAPMEWVGEEESARNLHEHEQDSILPSPSLAFYRANPPPLLHFSHFTQEQS